MPINLDALELMQAALAGARERVVLKWPLHAPTMAGLPKPSHQRTGKTTRYDVSLSSASAVLSAAAGALIAMA